jgi:hypothetical protein
MSILRGIKFIRVILVILVCLVSLTTFLPNGYCEDWVEYESNDDFTLYYKPSSVEFDKELKTVKVWTKWVYTEKGRIDYLKRINQPNNNDFGFKITIDVIDYKNNKYIVKKIIHYSKLGDILLALDGNRNWLDIVPNTNIDVLINKLLNNSNIQR